jgi:hypothetical protein
MRKFFVIGAMVVASAGQAADAPKDTALDAAHPGAWCNSDDGGK